MKKLRWLALIPLLLLLLAGAGLWAWQKLPEWVKPRAQAVVLEKLGRKLDWQLLELSWAEKKVVIKGLTLSGPSTAATAPVTLTIERIEAIVSTRSWNEKAAVIESLKIEKPIVKIARLSATDGANQYDFDDITQTLAKAPKTEPVRYAVSNIVVSDGLIEFDDKPVKMQHRADKVQLGIPFINTLIEPEKAQIAPALSALIDAVSPIDLKGELLPFGKQLQGVLNLKLDQIQVAKWQPYFPNALQLDFKSGQLNLDAQLKFLPKAQGSIELVGNAKLAQADLYIKRGPPLATALNLTVPLKQYLLGEDNAKEPSGQANNAVLHLGKIIATAREFHLQRDATGQMNWTRLWQAPKTSAPAVEQSALNLVIDGISIQAQQFKWQDAQNTALPQLNLSEFSVSAGAYSSSKKDKIDFGLDFKMAGAKNTAPLNAGWKGEYDQSNDQVRMAGQLNQLPLYLASAFVKTLGEEQEGPTALLGVADIAGEFSFKASDPGRTLKFSADELALKGVALVHIKAKGKQPGIFGTNKVLIKGLAVDLASNQFKAKAVEIDGLQTSLRRTASGVQVIGLAVKKPATVSAAPTEGVIASTTTSATAGATAGATSTQQPLALQWAVESFKCNACLISFADLVVKPNVNFDRTQVSVELGALDSKMNRPIQFKVAANSQVGQVWAGSAQGQATLQPFGVASALTLANFDMAKMEPYYTNALKLRVTRGTASTRGQLDLRTDAAGQLQTLAFVGDLNVGDFQTLEKSSGNEFIRWKQLSIPKFKVQSGGPSPTLVETGLVDIDQLYARVVLNEKGELNLRDGIVQNEVTGAGGKAAKPDSKAAAQIRIGGIKMLAGNINFSDQFIKPNYTANLTQLNGEMSALASDAPQPANLKVQGRVDSDAPLTIEGTLNPIAPTAQLDLRAEAKSVELTSLSAYSARWAGYAIEKGKLTAKVHYQIEQGRLNARNEILLNQLVLGEKIDSPQATRLPVKLAIALLKNSKGEIELDIPITGSLSDPEFAVGPLIWRTFLGLLGKIALSPFSALANLGGQGSEELSFIDFPSGSTELTEEGKGKVATLMKALKDRPGLTLDIGGKADEQADRAGLQRVTLDLMLKGVKLQRLIEANPKADTPDLDKLQIGLDERPVLVAQLYKNYNLPNKPKNILGLEKSVDIDEQQRLLQESISIPSDLVKQLAGQRGAVTREFLMKEIPGERLFVIAPKVIADTVASAQNRRVEFALR
jgi:Domain of Unknown Function (DUF748)